MIRFYRVLVFCAGVLVSIDLFADSLLPLGAILHRSMALSGSKHLLNGHSVRQRGIFGCWKGMRCCTGGRSTTSDSASVSQASPSRGSGQELSPLGGDGPPEGNNDPDDKFDWQEPSELEKILEQLKGLILSQPDRVRIWVMGIDGTLLRAGTEFGTDGEKKLFRLWRSFIEGLRKENKLILVYNTSRKARKARKGPVPDRYFSLFSVPGLPEPDFWILENGAVISSTSAFNDRYQRPITHSSPEIKLPEVPEVFNLIMSGRRDYVARDSSSITVRITNNPPESEAGYQRVSNHLESFPEIRLWGRPPSEQLDGLLYGYNPQDTKGSATRFVLETISSLPVIAQKQQLAGQPSTPPQPNEGTAQVSVDVVMPPKDGPLRQLPSPGPNQAEWVVTSFGDDLSDLSMMTENLQFPEPTESTTEPGPLPDNIRIEGAVVAHGSHLIRTGTHQLLNPDMTVFAEGPGLPGLMKGALKLMEKTDN